MSTCMSICMCMIGLGKNLPILIQIGKLSMKFIEMTTIPIILVLFISFGLQSCNP